MRKLDREVKFHSLRKSANEELGPIPQLDSRNREACPTEKKVINYGLKKNKARSPWSAQSLDLS